MIGGERYRLDIRFNTYRVGANLRSGPGMIRATGYGAPILHRSFPIIYRRVSLHRSSHAGCSGARCARILAVDDVIVIYPLLLLQNVLVAATAFGKTEDAMAAEICKGMEIPHGTRVGRGDFDTLAGFQAIERLLGLK